MTEGNSREKILKNIIKTAETYTPSWNIKAAAKDDVGFVFAQSFAELFSENEDLYEKMMKRHYVLFLNLFGISKKPCCSAGGIITVKPTANNAVHVRKGTRAGSDEGAEFTVTTDLIAVNTSITEILSVNDDVICSVFSEGFGSHAQSVQSIQSDGLSLFDFNSENLQKRMLILDLGDIQKGDEIVLKFFNTAKKDQRGLYSPLSINRDLIWEYITESGNVAVNPIYDEYEENTIRVKIDFELAQIYANEERENRLCIHYKKDDFPPLLNKNVVLMAVNTALRTPDSLYLNDIPLKDNNFNAFGECFTLYDCFYIQSDVCFSKSESNITIDLDFSLRGYMYSNTASNNIIWKEIIPVKAFEKPPALQVYIENAVWEYWNGNGWKRLFNDEKYSSIFKEDEKVCMMFRCPSDMANVYVGASYGLFVRCRIYKVTNGYSPEMAYMSPLVKSIKISYNYDGRFIPLKRILHSSNLTVRELDSGNYTDDDFSGGEPVTYICFNNEINSNFLSIYFNLKNTFDTKTADSNRNNFTWQAYTVIGTTASWQTLSKLDGTDGFNISGIVNLKIPARPVKSEFFGKSGYWFRIVSADKNQKKIALNRIEVNAAEVVQEQINRPLSFSVMPYEKNKQCQLTYGNIKDVAVYVTEGENNVVKWGEGDRLYNTDVEKGIITFGDGVRSRIPRHGGEPTIRIEYTTTDGEAGNVPAGSISRFLDPVPFVDYITNPLPAFGGKDIESFDNALKRGVGLVKSMGKCISADDYEGYALGADDLIYRVKCIEGKKYPDKDVLGAISLVVLPKTSDNESFAHIKKNIYNEILPLMPFYMAGNLNVLRAEYIDFVIYVSVTIDDFYEFRNVHLSLETRLKNYLNPLSGGKDGNGYGIGEFPLRSELLDVVKQTEFVSTVKYMKINCFEKVGDVVKEAEPDELYKKIFCVPRAKEVKITINS